MGEVRFLVKARLRVFFFLFFFFFLITLPFLRMKAQLFGTIVIGLLVIWMMDATAGEPISTSEKVDAIFANAEDKLHRLMRVKDFMAKGKRTARGDECHKAGEDCSRNTDCCEDLKCLGGMGPADPTTMTHPIFKMCLPKQNKKGTVIDWDGTKKGLL